MSKFFKDKKISQACSSYLHQIAQEIMLLLDTNLMKNILLTESQDGQNFGSTCTICNLHVVLHEKSTCLQPIRCA